MLTVYGRALGFEFVYDDRALIADNPALADWSTLPEALGHELFHFAPGVRPSPYWRPWISLGYYVDQAIGGGRPWAFHLHNLLLLWGCGVLLWRALRLELQLSERGALALALGFVLHPLLLEPAANVASRPDLWVAFWMLLALQSRSRPTVLIATLLACLSKELGVLLLPLSLLADWGRPRDQRRGDWPLQGVVVAAFLAARALVLSTQTHPTGASILEAGHRSLWLLARVLLPTPLAPAATLDPAPMWLALLSWGLLAVVAVALMLHRRLWVGAALLLGPVLMVSGLVSAETRYGDGLLLLPVLGGLWILGELSRGWSPRAGWALLLLPLVGGVHGALRLGEWRDEVSLWSAALERRPDDPILRLRLARTLVETDPIRALTLEPGRDMPEDLEREGWEVQGRAHLNVGDRQAALDSLLNALGPDEESLWAAETACSLGAQLGDTRALRACQSALALGLQGPGVYNNLGVLHMMAGQVQQGKAAFREGCALAPRPEHEVCLNSTRAQR